MKLYDPVFKATSNSAILNNEYFIHAKMDLDFLNSISPLFDKTVPYTPSAMSMAINILERDIKGLLQTMYKLDPTYKYPCIDRNGKTQQADAILYSHNMTILTRETEKYFVKITSIKDKDVKQQFLNNLTHEYTSSRYSTHPSLEEFTSFLNFVNNKDKLIRDFVTEKEKSIAEIKDNNIGNTENEDEENDEINSIEDIDNDET